MKKKIYLDDERQTPDGWHRCYWPEEVIEILKTEQVDVISLDHDLGEFNCEKPRTGYDVLLWIEQEVATNPAFSPPRILLHTANPAARKKMAQAAQAIIRFVQKRKEPSADSTQPTSI